MDVTFRQVKVLPPPEQLEAGALYFVQDGNQAKLYVTNTAATPTARLVHDGEHTVGWLLDADNNVLLDGVNGTTVGLPSSANFIKVKDAVTGLAPRVTAVESSLTTKANLDTGKHRISEYAEGVFRREWAISKQADLTTLGSAHIGDIAIAGTERWLLTGASPQVAANWFSLATGSNVTSINGKTGAVTLTAADVGALPSSTTAGQIGAAALSHQHSASQITDINSWLGSKIVQGTGLTISRASDGKLTFNVAASGLGIDWVDVANKPALYPTSWENVAGKPSTFTPTAHTHKRSEITDFAHTHPPSDITGFGDAAANEVGARITSNTLGVTAVGNGQIKLEVGDTVGGIVVQEYDGAPTVPIKTLVFPNGSLTQVSAGVVRVGFTSATTGENAVAYAPKYQRAFSVTNPYPFRCQLIIDVLVRSAFAQPDGRDIQVYSAAGSPMTTAVRAAVPSANYMDYSVAIIDTLDGSETRNYSVKYGDPTAQQRPMYANDLTKALSAATRLVGPNMTVRLDTSAGYRPSDFLATGGWVSTATQDVDEAGPLNVPLRLAGVNGNSFLVRKGGGTSWNPTLATSNRIEVTPSSGTVKPAFLMSFDYASPLSVAQAAGNNGEPTAGGGTCIVGHATPDGYVFDIRATSNSTTAYHDISIRYRAGLGWSWTLHHVQGTPTSSYLVGSAGVRDGNGNAQRFFDLVPYSTAPKRTDPTTWIAFAIDYQFRAAATVGDETLIPSP